MRSSPQPPPASVAAPAAPAPVSLVGVMVCAMLGPFVNILDYNVVNVSLPKMMGGLATDVLTIRWVMSSFLIATAVIMPTLGWIGRVMGNKNLYMLGLTVFTSASMLCGMAPNVNVLIALRVLQGLGAGVLMPMSMVLMVENYPPDKRGMGTALWGLGASLGSVIGLPLGGYFADAVDWRAVFYVNVLPGSLAVLGTLFLAPASRRERRVPFDVWGCLSLSIALVTLLVALSQGQRKGWDSSFMVTLLLGCGVSLLLFVSIERRTAAPLVDIRLYRRSLYVKGTVVALMMGLFFHGSTFLTVLFSQLLLDFSVQLTALALLPGSIAMVLTTPVVGWMIDRSEARFPMLIGLLIYCVCCYLMMLADLRIGVMHIVWTTIIRGFGLGFLYPPVYALALQGVPLERTRAALSLLNLQVTLGGACSIALLSTLMESRQAVHQTYFAEEQVLTSVGTQQALMALTRLAHELGAHMAHLNLQALGLLQGIVRREALVHALNDCFQIVLMAALCSMVIVLTMRAARHG
ncbi:Multidrug export protein EmrB [Candidatus Entotheonellaceae bacterium PAL068K]